MSNVKCSKFTELTNVGWSLYLEIRIINFRNDEMWSHPEFKIIFYKNVLIGSDKILTSFQTLSIYMYNVFDHIYLGPARPCRMLLRKVINWFVFEVCYYDNKRNFSEGVGKKYIIFKLLWDTNTITVWEISVYRQPQH